MERLTFKKRFHGCDRPQEKITTVCINGYIQVVEVDEITHEQNYFLVGEAIDKLSKYEDAEEQGLLLRLPCKVGTKVFEFRDVLVPVEDCPEDEWVCECRTMIFEEGFDIWMLHGYGKTVFLTREEAEQALRERGE